MKLLEYNLKIEVSDTEYKRLLRLPPSYEIEGRVAELADWA